MKRHSLVIVVAATCFLTAAGLAAQGRGNSNGGGPGPGRGNANGQGPGLPGRGGGVNPEILLSEFDRILRGYQISPVPLDLRGKDLELVGLGSYLVNAAGGCNDCHTNPPFAPGGDPFMGERKQINATNYLAGGVMFGPFRSRNLTPRRDSGLPAGLTFQQFRRTMRTGIDLKERHPDISPLLQVMPWPVYQELSDRDLRAIYEFLRSIPSASPGETQTSEP